MGVTVGCGVGLAEGAWLGRAVGSGEGLALLGCSVGVALGAGVGTAVGFLNVGCAEGSEVGRAVGARVGAYVTSCTPAPAIIAVPVQVVLPMQPSRIRYVCGRAPAGTVYCTCAHTSDPK